MSTTVQIHTAKTQDAAYLALLGRVTFSETFGHLFRDPHDLRTYLAQTFDPGKLAIGVDKADNSSWLAWQNGLPIGYAKLKRSSPTPFSSDERQCQLQKLYVLQDFHGSGAGTFLQDELLRTAHQEGFQSIWLSVLHSNHKAIHFYERHGFRAIGEHDFSIGKEDFHFTVMNKKL